MLDKDICDLCDKSFKPTLNEAICPDCIKALFEDYDKDILAREVTDEPLIPQSVLQT